jgi:hypothetical protein
MSGSTVPRNYNPNAPRRTFAADEDKPSVWQELALDTAVGIPILFLGSAAVLGSVTNAFAFFVIAVVCTAGFGLLILLPLACVLGALVRRPVVYFLRRSRSAPSAA